MTIRTGQSNFTGIDPDGGASVPGYTRVPNSLGLRQQTRGQISRGGRVSKIHSFGIAALNPPGGPRSDLPSLSLNKLPGDKVQVTMVSLTYEGPRIDVQIGCGWKPDTGFGGTNFEHGENLISSPLGAWGFSPKFGLPESNVATNYIFGLSSLAFVLTMTVPFEGTVQLRGGGQGKINDKIDTWIWIYDSDKLGSNAFGPDTEFLTDVDTDSKVVALASAVGKPSAVEIGYV